MAKDPAFLFYPGDWLGGTMGFSIEEKGAYLELLILQFNTGSFTEAQAKQVLSICKADAFENIKHKFILRDGKYINQRLFDEILKRKQFSESRRNNALSPKTSKKTNKKAYAKHVKAYAKHMEDENENENRDIIEDKNENEKGFKGEKKETPYQPCMDIYNKFILKKTGASAKIDGQQGKALKEIISYLSSQEKIAGDQEKIIEAWQYILNNHDKTDNFLQGQIKLSQINSNIINILSQIKNGKPSPTSGKKAGYTDAELINGLEEYRRRNQVTNPK